MTPLQIKILLHYYCSAADYRGGDFSAPAVQQEIETFEDHYLLEIPKTSRPKFQITDKGRCLVDAWLKAIEEISMPELVWTIPAKEQAQ